MEIEYTQTTTDYYNAYKHISRRLNSSTKWRYLATLTGVVFGFLLAFGFISIIKFYEKLHILAHLDHPFWFKLITDSGKR